MTARVFVIAPSPRFDVRDLHRFGVVCYLTPSPNDINPLAGNAAVHSITSMLERENFKPEVDMIALTGPVATVALVLAAAVGAYDGSLRVLIFDARDGGRYRMQTINPGV
jgi:hypothetical protein